MTRSHEPPTKRRARATRRRGARNGRAPDVRPGEEPTELGPASAAARRPRIAAATAFVAVVAIVAIVFAPLGGALRALLALALLALLVRLTITSNRDRRRDEDARRFFDRHGRWPEEGRAG